MPWDKYEVSRQVWQHSRGNRSEVEASTNAGCYTCSEIFPASNVVDWFDEWTAWGDENRARWAAQCPQCGYVTVLGSASGLPISLEYLSFVRKTHDEWSRSDL